IDLNQAGLLVNDMKLVFINQFVTASPQLPYGLVVLIHQSDMPMPMAIARIMVTFETEEDILATPACGLKVCSPDAINSIAGPNQVAIITKDVWPCLPRAMLLRRSIHKA